MSPPSDGRYRLDRLTTLFLGGLVVLLLRGPARSLAEAGIVTAIRGSRPRSARRAPARAVRGRRTSHADRRRTASPSRSPSDAASAAQVDRSGDRRAAGVRGPRHGRGFDHPRPTPAPPRSGGRSADALCGLGQALAILQIPSIGLNEVVVEGAGAAQLRSGPGHVRGTAAPGAPGNSVIAGHRRRFGGPFGDLASVTKGSTVAVRTKESAVRNYKVTSVRTVESKASHVLDPSDEEHLVLVGGSADLFGGRVVVVTADPVAGSPDIRPTVLRDAPAHPAIDALDERPGVGVRAGPPRRHPGGPGRGGMVRRRRTPRTLRAASPPLPRSRRRSPS